MHRLGAILAAIGIVIERLRICTDIEMPHRNGEMATRTSVLASGCAMCQRYSTFYCIVDELPRCGLSRYTVTTSISIVHCVTLHSIVMTFFHPIVGRP